MKHAAWWFANLFGYVFGWPIFAPLHHALITLSLHGLGYDNALKDSWTGEEWFIKNILAPKKPRVCLDIGANVGAYTALLLKHTDAKIYAFEPAAASFTELEKLAGPRVEAVCAAVAEVEGEATLYSKSEKDVKASLDPKVRPGKHEEKVRVVSVADFARTHNLSTIDFIKIDTEGYEREVLAGLGNVRPRFVQFEFNIHHLYRNSTLLELATLLPGYDFYRLMPHGMVRIAPRKFLDNIFMFSNIVAIRKDHE